MAPEDTLYDPFSAHEWAAELSKHDDWSYEVETRGDKSVIRVLDENGTFVTYL